MQGQFLPVLVLPLLVSMAYKDVGQREGVLLKVWETPPALSANKKSRTVDISGDAMMVMHVEEEVVCEE